MTTARKRIGALLLCVGLVLVLSVSIAFIAHEAGHDCAGDECPVCRTIAVNIRLLRTLGLALLFALSFFCLLSGRAAARRRDRHARFLSGTLVSWKVRLDN